MEKLELEFSTLKVIACYSVFNEADFLQASLSLIEPHVDEIWLVDGPYANFEHTESYSTDGTLTIIQSFSELHPKKIKLLASAEFPNQMAKRNTYLEKVAEGDWLFIIDGDELPWGNLHQLKTLLHQEKYLVVNVLLQHTPLLAAVPLPRLIHKINGMKYKDHHAHIDLKGENILESSNVNIGQLYPIHLIHLNAYRSAERQEKKDFYFMFKKFQNDEEKPWQLATGASWKKEGK